jgi:hypothetical protein
VAAVSPTAQIKKKERQRVGLTASSRAKAQAVSRRLSTAAARVQSRVRSYGICSFPCQFSFHRLLHTHHHVIIRGWYNTPISDRSIKWTVSPHTKKQKKKRLTTSPPSASRLSRKNVEPRHLIIVRASTACKRDRFTFFFTRVDKSQGQKKKDTTIETAKYWLLRHIEKKK